MTNARLGICFLLWVAAGTMIQAQAPTLSQRGRRPQLTQLTGRETLPPHIPEALPVPGEGRLGDEDISLEEAEGIALASNPSLARAAARVDAARGRWVQAGLYPNPVIGYMGGEIGDEGTAGQQGGFIGQEFVTAGKLQLNRQIAKRDVELAQQAFAAQRWKVLTDVRVFYYRTLISQRRVEVAKQLLDIGQQGFATAQALFRGKEVSRADVLRAQIERDTTRVELARAQATYVANWRTLIGVMGAPKMPLRRLSGEWENTWPEYEWHSTIQRLLAESPLMAAAATRVQRARWTLNRAKVEPIPNVTVQAGVQENTASGDTIASVQASIPLPIFDRNQGNIQAARSELMAAKRDVDRLALALQNRLAPVFAQYEAARQQALRYQQDILQNSRETLNLITTGYRQGEFQYTDLLTVQRTYFQAELTYLQAVQEARAAAAQIEGLVLTGSLAD